MTGLTAAEVATVREVRSHIVTGHKLTPLLVEDLLAIVDRLTGNVGHCAGPSWAAHEVLAVATGEPCPACGTVMPMTNTCAACGRIYDPAKPHDCADRTAFTHGLELLRQMEDPVVDCCVVKWAGPCYLGGEWHYCSRLAEHIGHHGCECGEDVAAFTEVPA